MQYNVESVRMYRRSSATAGVATHGSSSTLRASSSNFGAANRKKACQESEGNEGGAEHGPSIPVGAGRSRKKC